MGMPKDRSNEGRGVNRDSPEYQNSKLWDCKACNGEKFRNKCINEKCERFGK